MSMRSALAAGRAISWRFLKVVVAVGVAVALAGGLGGSALARAAGQAGGAFRAAAAPSARHPVARAILSGVSCRGRSFCMAVGNYSEPGHDHVRLAEEWNGRKWRIVADPLRGDLSTLTCGSPSFCLADRTSVRRVAVWNGRTWRTLKNQPADGRDVACGSATVCMAFDGSQIQGWNGRRWRVLAGSDICAAGPPGDPCGWDSGTLTCGSGTNCMALGFVCTTTDCLTGPETFAAAWNGSSWDLIFTPFVPGHMACAGRDFCMITAAPATAAVSNGAGWRDASPDLAAICNGTANCTLAADLSCGHPGACMALPATSPVSLAWSRMTWKAVPLARVNGRIPQLRSLSCASASNCMAVGSYRHSPLTIAEHWNGSKWQVSRTPNP